MALKKEIIQKNGIVLSYHRIASITNKTNKESVIEIISYINQKARNDELNYERVKEKNQDCDINTENEITEEERKILDNEFETYTNTKFVNLKYNSNLNTYKAYDYLKTLDEFKDSEDV